MVLSKRRNQLKIWIDILKIIRNENVRTAIMQSANVSWIQLMIHLDRLQELKLIRVSTENEIYISEKGRLLIQIVGDKV